METLITRGTVASESKAGTAIAVATTFLAISTVIVSLRIYCRAMIIRELGVDDWAVLISWFFTVATGIVLALCTKYGFGHHTSTLSKEGFLQFNIVFVVLVTVYNIALASIKASFLFQYRRVFTLGRMRIVCNIVIAFVIFWGVLQVFLTLTACSPVQADWNPYITGKCAPNLPLWYLNSAVNIFTDFVIFLAPIPVLSTLNLGLAQKRVLIGVFSLGIFTCAISFIRISTLKEASSSTDPTWDGVATACWSMVELGCGIICVCVPVLKPMFSKLWPRVLSTTRNYYRHSKQLHNNPEDGRVGESSGGSLQKDKDYELSHTDHSVLDTRKSNMAASIRSTTIGEVEINPSASKVLATQHVQEV